MTNLILLSTRSDMSSLRFYEEARNLDIQVSAYDYMDLLKLSVPKVSLPIPKNSHLLARQPYSANQIEQNFVTLLDQVIQNYDFKKIMDQKLYTRSFIQYEDKHYQSYLFNKHQIPYAPLVNPLNSNHNFPIIAKKRLSSRAFSNYILNNKQDLEDFIQTHDISQFIFQQFFKLQSDFRVLVSFGKVIAIVRREVIIKDKNRPTVRVQGQADLPQQLLDSCQELSIIIGCDLCGFDIGQKENGDYFFIEYNASPQFLGIERETSINIAQKVISSLCSLPSMI